jgi:hypothetical protein
MKDPRTAPTFVVRVTGDAGVGASSLAAALLDFPHATDDEVARLKVLDVGEEPAVAADAALLVARGMPSQDAPARIAELATSAKVVLVAVHARDLDVAGESGDEALRAAWGERIDPSRVALTSTAPGKSARGVDDLRAMLLRAALDSIDVPVDRARRARRPYATAIIAGAAVVTAGEGLLPGAAAFVAATQVGAIASLYYLYTGRWLARSQALAILPAFASEAVGGSVFLLVKSFLPPTGVADAVAAGVAASLTISMLGAVAWALEQGYSLHEKTQLTMAFKRMKTKTRAERARVVASRHRWTDKAFWADLVRRVVFD